jgi:hypothetical protein
VGAWQHLDFTVTNRSGQAVHSFALRCLAGPGGHPSGAGVQPEGGLAPDAFVHAGFGGTGYLGIQVDFVQFVQDAVWYSGDEESLVTEAGVEAGNRAASVHLQSVLARSDAATVMARLARVHADVVGPMSNPLFGPFGFYTGVNNMAVQLRHACSRDGLDGVERLLRSDRVGG